MAIECVLSVEKEEYRALYEVIANQRSNHRIRLLLPLSAIVATVLALVVPMSLFLGVALLLYSASALLWYVFYPQFQAWEAYRHRDATAEIAAFTYRFEEDKLHILHPTHEQTVPYTEITTCTETETHFVLFAKKQVFCMAKETMTDGTAEKLRALLAQHFAYTAVKLEKAPRRRVVLAATTAIVTVAVIIAVRGATYIRRPVTIIDEGHSITISLPQFMRNKGDGLYVGNGIEAKTEYVSQEKMKEHMDAVLEKAPAATIANYAAYLQKSEAVPPKGEWVAVSKTEYYMSYADGAAYRYTVLRADTDGVWIVWFRCPGERQDTYYSRFDTWREDIQY